MKLVQIGDGAWVNPAAVASVIVDTSAGAVNLYMVDGRINAAHPAPGVTLDQWAAELVGKIDPMPRPPADRRWIGGAPNAAGRTDVCGAM